MVNATHPLPEWIRPAETKEKLDYATLAEIDLSKWWKGEKDELLNDIRVAVHEVGFWFVTNTGIEDDEVRRQLAIGEAFLDLPLEEKQKYPCDFQNGNFFGFREGTRVIGTSGVKDNSEALCLPKVTPELAFELPAYDFVKTFQDEIQAFQKKVHERVLTPLLSLFALLLELPEDYFLKPHEFERATEDHLRYMRYQPNSKETDAKIDNVHLAGHTDFGLVTLLFAQVVMGLQLKTPDGWKYVPYIPNSIVVNTADVLSFLSNGYLKSTIHRVVRPPDDQATVPRHGLFYFSRAANDLEMLVAPSPLLKRLGLYPTEQPDTPVKGLDARLVRKYEYPYDLKYFRISYSKACAQVKKDDDVKVEEAETKKKGRSYLPVSEDERWCMIEYLELNGKNWTMVGLHDDLNDYLEKDGKNIVRCYGTIWSTKHRYCDWFMRKMLLSDKGDPTLVFCKEELALVDYETIKSEINAEKQQGVKSNGGNNNKIAHKKDKKVVAPVAPIAPVGQVAPVARVAPVAPVTTEKKVVSVTQSGTAPNKITDFFTRQPSAVVTTASMSPTASKAPAAGKSPVANKLSASKTPLAVKTQAALRIASDKSTFDAKMGFGSTKAGISGKKKIVVITRKVQSTPKPKPKTT